MASKFAVLFKLYCVFSFPKLPYPPPLSALLHAKSIGLRKVMLPMASLKLHMQCTLSLVLDLMKVKTSPNKHQNPK